MTVKILSVAPLSATDKKIVNTEYQKAIKALEKCNLKLIKKGDFYHLKIIDDSERVFFYGYCYKRNSNTYLKIIDIDIIIYDNNVGANLSKNHNILMLNKNNILSIIG